MKISLLLGTLWPASTHGWTSFTDQISKGTELKCENDEVQLTCLDNDDVIKINKVFYGREDTVRCAGYPGQSENVKCRSNPIDIVAQKCRNVGTCRFNVNDEVFVDPCPGTRKYVEIKYECIKFEFGQTKSYFTISNSQTYSIPTSSGQIWASDPLDSSRRFYQLIRSTSATTQVNIYNQLANDMYSNGGYYSPTQSENRGYLGTLELETPARDSNFVVWKENIFYVSVGDPVLVKYSAGTQNEVERIPLSSLSATFNPGLFDSNFIPLVSEIGIFGAFRDESIWNLVKISTEGALKFGQIYTTGISSNANDRCLLIGENFHVIRDGKIIQVVNIKSKEVIKEAYSLPYVTSSPRDVIAYAPRNNQLIISSDSSVKLIDLKFLNEPIRTTKKVTTTIEPIRMSDATTTTTRQPIKIKETTATNKKDEYDEYEEETTSNSYLMSERINDQSETSNVIWPNVIGELAGEISKLESARDQINLIENVSKQVLDNMKPDQKEDINQALIQLLDELHCWSLVESESFLWLMSTTQSDDEANIQMTNQSVLLRPSRCSKNTNYIFYQSAAEPVDYDKQSQCFYFSVNVSTINDENIRLRPMTSDLDSSNWSPCECSVCPPSLFFKIENDSPFGPNILSISIAVCTSILVLFNTILVIFRESEMSYPPTLRFIIALNQIILFGCALVPYPFIRDVVLTLSALVQFKTVLCISHCLFQKSKPVSQDDSEDVKLRRYIFLIVVSSTIILIITCSIFLVLRNDILIGWLSLSITWSAALLSPILVTCLISSAWLVQSALSNGPVRIMAIKFLTYLTALTFTTISLVLSFLTIVNVDWILAILFLVTCLISVLCLAPQCHLVETRNTMKNTNNMSNRQQNWLQIDNRSSLADFRYIPVVHNIHSQNFQKPRSIDRLYTEIIPTETDVFENGSQLAQSFGHVTQPNPHKLAQMSYCQTTNQIANQMTNQMNGSQMMSTNQIACNNSNVDWFHQSSFKLGNFREDSGVHTAQNSSDSASSDRYSDRNSPILAIEESKSLLPNQKGSKFDLTNHMQGSKYDLANQKSSKRNSALIPEQSDIHV